jgi:hypothetical protein
MSLLEELVRTLPDAERRPSQFHDGPALWIDGHEFLHFHGDDLVEIRLTRRLIATLDEPRAASRARTSHWVIVAAAERELVLDLAARALEANRALSRRALAPETK